MARVNLERRAQIGLAKRARTRAAILQAARGCYAAQNGTPVTVESVMQAAGLAKGTFYVHFEDLPALEAELGEALIQEMDERLQPARLTADHPLTRLATAITILLRDLAGARTQARLVVRAAVTVPEVRDAMRTHLRQDLADAEAAGLLALPSVDLAARLVTALCVQAAREIGDGRINVSTLPDIVRAILRLIGCAPSDAAMHESRAARHADAFAQETAATDGKKRRRRMARAPQGRPRQ
jgi:AcrR family transcriptional regulator